MSTLSHDTRAAIDAAIKALAGDPHRMTPEGRQVMVCLTSARDIVTHGAEAEDARPYMDLAHVVALIVG